MIERRELGSTRLLHFEHGKANAMDLEFCRTLADECDAAERDGVRALVLTGNGAIFSAGVDLVRLRDGGPSYVSEFMPALDRCFEKLFFLGVPTVAAVNGHAIAGGAVLALACDYRLMNRGAARIGLAEHKVGVPFPALVVEMVRATLAPPVAQEALLLGPTFTPDDALARGFLNEVVAPEQLLARAEAVAKEMAAVSLATYRITKERLRRPAREAVAAHAATDDAATIAAWSSKEVLDAVRDYVAKTLKR